MILIKTSGIQFYSDEHFLIIAITIILCTGLPLFARRRLDKQAQEVILRGLSIIIFAAMSTAIIFRLSNGLFDWRANLPLNLCNFLAVVLPFSFWKHRPRHRVEVSYYVIMAGTFQGILTPNLNSTFPSILYFTYWVVHAGLVLYIVYLVSIWGIYPRRIGIIYTLLWVNAYSIIMIVFNYFSGSNYMYLMEKPRTGSILDLLGPWPWYILAAELVALVLCFIAWLPFAKRIQKNGGAKS